MKKLGNLLLILGAVALVTSCVSFAFSVGTEHQIESAGLVASVKGELDGTSPGRRERAANADLAFRISLFTGAVCLLGGIGVRLGSKAD